MIDSLGIKRTLFCGGRLRSDRSRRGFRQFAAAVN